MRSFLLTKEKKKFLIRKEFELHYPIAFRGVLDNHAAFSMERALNQPRCGPPGAGDSDEEAEQSSSTIREGVS
jgi:hypothetical protein